ncbi:Regulator of G-protein signaling 7 [Portunus trituberculatus]|uniref:Regulator of G-protein signaling 7 n=1 Tax=Portunus trituberculatus TaxID=210409 RepID=A0A5B7IJZ7_PORTR|nr:Regulator of G-protein signaling 7 [Portunus trituberculatus]
MGEVAVKTVKRRDHAEMEKIVEQMQHEETGVPVRTVKSFMTKIPSVFTGADLILWMLRNLDVEDQSECFHRL